MPKVLKDIQIFEVSAVDRGAGEGVKVLLMKRASESGPAPAKENGTMDKKYEDFLAGLVSKHEKKVAKRDARKAIEKAMLPSEAAFYQTLGKADAKSFRKMTAEERAAIIKAGKFPPKKKPAPGKDDDADDDDMGKLAKRLEASNADTLAKALSANSDLQKRIAKMEEDKALDIAKADCREMGLAESEATMLVKARSGDREAIGKLEDALKTLKKQRDEAARTGKIFAEIGKAGGSGPRTALDELNDLAAAVRKADPKLTPAQAFDKVVSDPANSDIVKREREEHIAKIQKLAA